MGQHQRGCRACALLALTCDHPWQVGTQVGAGCPGDSGVPWPRAEPQGHRVPGAEAIARLPGAPCPSPGASCASGFGQERCQTALAQPRLQVQDAHGPNLAVQLVAVARSFFFVVNVPFFFSFLAAQTPPCPRCIPCLWESYGRGCAEQRPVKVIKTLCGAINLCPPPPATGRADMCGSWQPAYAACPPLLLRRFNHSR